jgi:hypothetical protein
MRPFIVYLLTSCRDEENSGWTIEDRVACGHIDLPNDAGEASAVLLSALQEQGFPVASGHRVTQTRDPWDEKPAYDVISTAGVPILRILPS